MKIGLYLRDRIPLLLLMVIASVLSYVFLTGTGTVSAAAIFVICLFDLLVCIWVCIDFVRKFPFFRQLAWWTQKNEAESLPLNQLPPPGFAEGEAIYAALEMLDGSRQKTMVHASQTTAEYQEYIESWVHEIKTPLASAQLALDNASAEKDARIRKELQRMEGYVQQVLFYARASNVEKDLRIRPVVLGELVRAILRKNAKLLIKAGFSIRQETLDVTVMADASWLEFVFAQIVSNAVKYRRACIAPTLSFTGVQQENRICLHVQDNGMGIAPQELPRIFDKAFCGENGRKVGKSTGMGLYIAKKLCDKMGLDICAESVQEQGTCFTVYFPLGDEYSLTKM